MSLKKEYIAILVLGLPILVGQLGSIVTGFVDNMMVGHFSTQALAAASFCNNFFNTAMLACMGFTMGITPLVGAMSAGKNTTDIGRMMRTAVRVNTLFCCIVTAIMGILYFFVDRMGQPVELLPLIRPYYLLCLAGMIPVTLFNAFAQWSYGINNTSTPMWIILGVNVLNVIGNYALIFGNFGMPRMGLTGAGISTFAARIIAGAAMIAVFFYVKKYSDYRKGYSNASSRPYPYGKIWLTSLPVSLQMAFETAAFSGAAVLCGWLGTIPLAAFQVIVVMGTLGFCVYYAIGAAVAVRVSNSAGTGDVRAMRRSAWAGYHIMLAIMVLSSLTFVFAGPTIISVITDDTAVIAVAVSLIVPMVLYQLGDATQITFANALRGTTRVMPMLWCALFSYLILGLPSSFLLGFTCNLGVYGIVLSFSVSLFTAAALYLYFFVRETRLHFSQN